MAGTGDKLMTASEIKEVTDTKLVKDFSSLTALSGTPATGDLVPIKSGNDTYKIDYNALASAILGQISSSGVVNVANGGTGSGTATGALSGLIGALDTSSGFSLSDTIPVSINGTTYTITGSTLSNAVVGGGTGVTATLPIVNGGTGAASASAARTALDVYSKSETTNAIAQSTASGEIYVVYGTYCTVQKKAGVVYIYGNSSGGLSLTGDADWHSLTTIPVGYRPATTVYFAGASASGKGISFRINASGLLEYVAGTGNTTSYWSYGASYISD